MTKVTQLTIFEENVPGKLAKVAKAFGDAGVNIVDFVTGTMGVAAYVQVIVDDVAKAKEALTRGGFVYSEQTVLFAEVKNVPGTLAQLAAKLAAQNINIHSGYATTMLGDASTSVVLAVSDADAAAAIPGI